MYIFRNPVDCYVWVVRGAIGKMRVRRMIYISEFEGPYWRPLRLSRHTSVLRLLRRIAIENRNLQEVPHLSALKSK